VARAARGHTALGVRRRRRRPPTCSSVNRGFPLPSGTYNFWDKDSKQRLKAQGRAIYPNGQPAPVTAGAFDRTGAIYGYALSYDWSKGYAEYNAQTMKP
jgi:hypothetical protein